MTRKLTRCETQRIKHPITHTVVPRLTRYCLECYRLLEWDRAIAYVITLCNALKKDGEHTLSVSIEEIMQLHSSRQRKAASDKMKITARQILSAYKLKKQNVKENTKR